MAQAERVEMCGWSVVVCGERYHEEDEEEEERGVCMSMMMMMMMMMEMREMNQY